MVSNIDNHLRLWAKNQGFRLAKDYFDVGYHLKEISSSTRK